jgi:UDP-3-O-acyl N-acetylglucosamine deacetylase
VIKISHRRQRTISRPSGRIVGVGFITGADVTMRFRPAPADAGIVFVRTDLPESPRILSDISQVTDTNRRTTLGSGSHSVTLVEHVLAALAGLRIDNCIVELNAPEPPGLDGSSRGFVETLLDADIVPQEARKTVWSVEESVVLRDGGATLGLHPGGDDLTISYMLDYGPTSPIARQTHTQRVTPGEFAAEIAQCRTFLLEEEAHALRKSGIGSRTSHRDLLVFGPRGPLENELRFANEPARHKVLDLIGDLALCGLDIRGHIVAYRSGHPLNTRFAHTLMDRFAPICARPMVGCFRRAA